MTSAPTRRARALPWLLGAAALAAGAAIGLWRGGTHAPAARVTASHDAAQAVAASPGTPHAASDRAAPSEATAVARLDADGVLAPQTRDDLGALLLERDDFARDLLFLLAASLRDRCAPAHAHELARMAVAAHLPALDGAGTALATRPELRRAAYALVRLLAATAPCGRVLHIAIGRYQADLAPERYAAAFPDSYFEPNLDTPPPDVAARDLGQRSADPCTPIVYAVLPLDAERAWECMGLRATLRRRLQDTCAAGLRDGPAAADRTATQLAASIHDDLRKLPAMCQ